MNFCELDKKYIDLLRNQSRVLKEVYVRSSKSGDLDLESLDLSNFIIQRMKSYYELQDSIKTLLNKKYSAPGADFFVESVVWAINMGLIHSGSQLKIHSEENIIKGKKGIRPDISVWNKDELLSIIECKTQLGWNRVGWKKDFRERVKKLRESHPKAKAYLLVMTGNNWEGFSKKEANKNNYYCLLKDKWPTQVGGELGFEEIFTPIEKLIKDLLKQG